MSRSPADITFSIATPICGQAEFLPTALASLLVQHMPFEWAVLDATPDDSVQRVLANHDQLITYRYHHPDRGQSAAIQEGWNNTSGRIVAWLNADDYYYPDTLAKVAEAFARHPEADVVFGHATHVSPDGEFQMYFPAIDEDPGRLLTGCSICQPSCFVRRSAMERVGGLDASLHYAMDWDLWARLHTAGAKFVFLDEVLSAVRIYPETKTLSGARRRYQELDTILRTNGVSALRRARVLFKFRCYDYLNRPTSRLAAHLRQFVAQAARLYRGYKPSRRPPILGLDPWTNRVADGSCRVLLPVYGSAGELTLKIVTDRPIALDVTVNGRRCQVAAASSSTVRTFAGEPIATQAYLAGPCQPADQLLRVVLRSPETGWRLMELSVAASAAAGRAAA